VLRKWRKQQRLALGSDYHDPGVWVFTWEDGNPYHPEYLTKSFNRLARRHGLPPADCSRTCPTAGTANSSDPRWTRTS
jgi:hypothetical protein